MQRSGECAYCDVPGASCPTGETCRHAEAGQCAPWNPGLCFQAQPREPRRFVFSGTVDSLTDGLGLFSGVLIGDRFHGSLTYDLTTPDTGPIGEGFFGLYLHESPPAGVTLTIGGLTARSEADGPRLYVVVNNDVGALGQDMFGFTSLDTELVGAPFGASDLAIDFGWTMTHFVQPQDDPLWSDALPACPVDPETFDLSNALELSVECTVCAGPFALSDLVGTVDVFESALVLRVDRDEVWWSPTETAVAYDVLTGDVGQLGDFSTSTTGCLVDDWWTTWHPVDSDPAPGEGWWYLVRPERTVDAGSWDSGGLGQGASRDAGIAASAATCL